MINLMLNDLRNIILILPMLRLKVAVQKINLNFPVPHAEPYTFQRQTAFFRPVLPAVIIKT